VKKTQSSQFAFAEQAVLHAEASATTPTCTLFVAALSMDPARFRHSVKKVQINKIIYYTLSIYTYFFTFTFYNELYRYIHCA
jgi:hypothetical protein